MFQSIALTQMPDTTNLFKEYLSNSEWRKEQLGYSLLNIETDILARQKDLVAQKFDRNGLSQIIKNYMAEFGLSSQVNLSLEKLKNPECVCIVTGQQPALFGGPLYNYYKAISAIKLALQMEKKTGKPFVPIFWNASNDHDVEEANRIYYLDKQRRMVKGSLSGLSSKPLHSVMIGREILQLKSKIENEISRVDFLSDAWQKLLPLPEDSIGSWQTRILNQIFADKGLLILEPKVLKSVSKNAFSRLLKEEDRFIKQVQVNSDDLKNKNFQVQVEAEATSRMMLYQKGIGRNRLQKKGDKWLHEKKEWNATLLIENIENPDIEMTPDALGRPIWQDMIIPVAAYVAGPGEIAYYHQLKGCYEIFGMKMPLILPRESGTILEKNHIKLLTHFKVSTDLFIQLKNWVRVPSEVMPNSFEISPSLIENWLKNAKNPEEIKIVEVFKSKLMNLNKKFYEKIDSNRKNKMEIGNKQLQEWKDFIFPKQLTQERVYGALPIFARHGADALQFLENVPYEWGRHFIYTLND